LKVTYICTYGVCEETIVMVYYTTICMQLALQV
jgi:hypothetical protein